MVFLFAAELESECIQGSAMFQAFSPEGHSLWLTESVGNIKSWSQKKIVAVWFIV